MPTKTTHAQPSLLGRERARERIRKRWRGGRERELDGKSTKYNQKNESTGTHQSSVSSVLAILRFLFMIHRASQMCLSSGMEECLSRCGFCKEIIQVEDWNCFVQEWLGQTSFAKMCSYDCLLKTGDLLLFGTDENKHQLHIHVL